jgi:hypothetical protein
MPEKKEIKDEKILYNREVFMRHLATVHKMEPANGMKLSLPAKGAGMFFA